MGRINVGILFGGKSPEHEVSLRSARNIFKAIDRDKYNPVLIPIDKSGRWFIDPNLVSFFEGEEELKSLDQTGESVILAPQSDGILRNIRGEDEVKLDVIFPVLHGPFGEDGTVQGLLKLANLPFVGPSVLGSAVGMDKDIMKRLLRDAGLPIGKFIVFKSEENILEYEEVENKLGSPFFVKPANMGSSVGVSKVSNKEEYLKAIQYAFDYDLKIIIEEFIEGREIECSVLGNEDPIASIPGEVIPTHDFYSYEAKYTDDSGAVLEIPAKLSDEKTKEIQEVSIKTFKVLSCEGLGRVDSFLKKDGSIFINEINTIPGFTSISMYPKLFEESGIKYKDLIDKLIQLAIERFKKENKLKTSYSD